MPRAKVTLTKENILLERQYQYSQAAFTLTWEEFDLLEEFIRQTMPLSKNEYAFADLDEEAIYGEQRKEYYAGDS